jgi:hypothetical protein
VPNRPWSEGGLHWEQAPVALAPSGTASTHHWDGEHRHQGVPSSCRQRRCYPISMNPSEREPLTLEERTARFFHLIDVARFARGLVLGSSAELDFKIEEILGLAFCPEPGPRQLLRAGLLSDITFDKRIQLLTMIVDTEYPNIVSADFKARLGHIRKLRNQVAHWILDDSDDALLTTRDDWVRLVSFRGGSKVSVEITSKALESYQVDIERVTDDLVTIVDAVRARRGLPAQGPSRFVLPPKP